MRGTASDLLGPLNDVEAKYAPEELFVAGDVSLLRRSPRIAIVGSRDASPAGLALAASLSQGLVGAGAVIVSGLARGIDAAAHRAAIEAGGRTIAVLGTPLDQCAVRENRALQDLIGRDHLLVSQFRDGEPVHKSYFPRRNRTMAIICDASIIIEAGDGSGTLSQGWEAIRIGRPLFLSSLVARSRTLEWPKKMIAYGAIELPACEFASASAASSTSGAIDEILAFVPTPCEVSDAGLF